MAVLDGHHEATEAVARCLSRSLGRLEALDGERCRPSATTGNSYYLLAAGVGAEA
jgi:hypothetical protein